MIFKTDENRFKKVRRIRELTTAGTESVPVHVPPSLVRYEVWSEPTEAGKAKGIQPKKLGGPYEARSYANWIRAGEMKYHDIALHDIVTKEIKP